MPRPRARKSVHINAEPQDVYDFAVGDLSSLPDWLTSVDEVLSADANWPAVNSSHTYTRTVNKRTVTGTTTVVEVNPPWRIVTREKMTSEAQPDAPSRAGRSIWTFESRDGGTLATMELEGAELSWPVYLLWKLLFGRQVTYNLDQSLAALKRICEEELEDVEEGS